MKKKKKKPRMSDGRAGKVCFALPACGSVPAKRRCALPPTETSTWDAVHDDNTFNVFAGAGCGAAGDAECAEREADAERRRDAARALQARGNAHAEAGRLAEALSAWAAGLSAQPPARERARLHESRAQVRMLRGEWFAAVEEAAAAAAAQPAWPAAHATLGRAQLNLGEPSLAARTL